MGVYVRVACRLSASLLLLNLQSTHNVSNVFMDALFKLLGDHLLPAENTLPKSHDQAKSLLSQVGMEYHAIHACPNGCTLFWKDLEAATECPTCEAKRYRVDTIGEKVPMKVRICDILKITNEILM